MSFINYYIKLSLSKKIYISTFMGLLIGLFFGDLCKELFFLNNAFIQVFQIAIIPYMIFSIIQAIGSLDNKTAKIIGKRGGLILLMVWGVSIFYALSLKVSLPDIQATKFFSPASYADNNSLHFIDLFIPKNPFYSLAQGHIPAIVIFCVLIGIAIINEKKKVSLIEYSKIMTSVMKKINDYVIYLLPLGILTMSSYTFGTLTLGTFKGVLVFILVSLVYLFLMSIVILPGIVISMTALTYRRFLIYSMPAALIAFTTGNIFLSLPVIYEEMNKFEQEQADLSLKSKSNNEQESNIVNIIVPLVWIVPASYKFLVIFFIVFANWYYANTDTFLSNLFTYIGGLPCLFGNTSTTLPFLLEISDLPGQAYNIFMITASIMVYFNSANGAIFIVACTVLCYTAIRGKLKIAWFKLFNVLILGLFMFLTLLYGVNFLMSRLLSENNTVKDKLLHMSLDPYSRDYYSIINASYLSINQYIETPSAYSGEPLLDKIVRTKTLKVGYNPLAPPFSFFNQYGELVGFDIDTVYDIANDLACNRIEFYEINNITEYQECLSKGQIIDIYVGGHMYRAPIMGNIMTSDAYMDLHQAVVIPSKDKDKYTDFFAIFKDQNATVGQLKGPNRDLSMDVNILKGKEIVPLSKVEDYFKHRKTYALLTSAETAYAISILYPNYSVIEYKGEDVQFYFAYILPAEQNAFSFRHVVNSWIRNSFMSGLLSYRYNYWIVGKIQINTTPRWSILRWLYADNCF